MKQIPCFKHEGSYLLFIKQDKNETNYGCEQCCVGQDNSYKFIHINNALKSPEYLLSKLNISPSLSEYFTKLNKYDDIMMQSILNDFQTKIENLQNALQAFYKELEQHAKSVLEMKYKIMEELKKIIKFDQFKQFAVNLEQLGDSINPQAIEQNEKIMHTYLQGLTKNDCSELNNTLFEMLNRLQKDPNEEQYPQYKKLEEQFKQLALNQQNFAQLNSFKQFLIKQDQSLLSYNESQKIVNTIQTKSNKQVKNLQQIYLGSRDGLSANAFWNKVNGKSNLLMIFKSKSGNIFGAYSPCQWQQSGGAWVLDNTLSSFLFSQTHDQIYPLKEGGKGKAIYCNESYGPTFGNGHDLKIDSSFQGGHSNGLGYSYQCDQYQIANKSTHLFGQTTPNIAECEIYQVIFA